EKMVVDHQWSRERARARDRELGREHWSNTFSRTAREHGEIVSVRQYARWGEDRLCEATMSEG
ncbi:hypothetical protein U1Q18_052032, partial [Sarracenia purpurea var. burkii]